MWMLLKLQVLRALFMAYVSPCIEGDVIVTDGDPGDDAPADDEPADDEPADDEPADDEPADDPAPEPRVSRAQKAIIETRQRAQKAETDLAAVRAELAEARRAPAQPTEQEVLWKQEEDVLRNPETTDWQRYSINAARGSRAAEARSNQALARAEDLADKTAFAALATTKPKLYATYKDRVEETLADARKKGANPSRENVLAFMVGQDMIKGNLKTSEGKTAKPSSAPRAAVRSDVAATSSGRMSEAEKRTRRLEGQRI